MTIVKSIINIFTIKDGKICLITKNRDLIKVECLDDLDLTNDEYIKKELNIKDINLKQCHTFSTKNNNILEIEVLYVDILNTNDINLSGFEYFTLDEVYNLKDIDIINKSIEYLKNELTKSITMKKLYPSEFALPEIQKIYEDLLGKKLDRRNFRKRLMNLDIIEDLNKVALSKNGRPAKLYKFKEINENKILF